VQQQIWGEMVYFNLAFFQFIWECNSENIIKIGPYLPKLLQEKFGAVFLAHPVYLWASIPTFFPWHTLRKICNKAVIKNDPTTPETGRYTTLWNVNVTNTEELV